MTPFNRVSNSRKRFGAIVFPSTRIRSSTRARCGEV